MHTHRPAALCGAIPAAFLASCSIGGIRVALDRPSEGGSGGEPEIKALVRDLKTATDEVKRFAGTVETEIRNLGTVTGETKAAADKALTEMNGLSARLTEIEQKMARRPGEPGPSGHASLGHAVIDDPEMKAAIAKGDTFKGRVQVEVKAITSASVSGSSATTALVTADRQAGLIGLPTADDPEAVRVRFQAGYEAGHPEVQPVRHAIVLGAVQLRALATQDLSLRSRTVAVVAQWG